MTRTLTKRQRVIWGWIREYAMAHGYPPTIREIGNAHGIRSTNGVVTHLKALRSKGALAWIPGSPRTIRVLEVQE